MSHHERIVDSLLTSGDLEDLSTTPGEIFEDVGRARLPDEVARQLAELKSGIADTW